MDNCLANTATCNDQRGACLTEVPLTFYPRSLLWQSVIHRLSNWWPPPMTGCWRTSPVKSHTHRDGRQPNQTHQNSRARLHRRMSIYSENKTPLNCLPCQWLIGCRLCQCEHSRYFHGFGSAVHNLVFSWTTLIMLTSITRSCMYTRKLSDLCWNEKRVLPNCKLQADQQIVRSSNKRVHSRFCQNDSQCQQTANKSQSAPMQIHVILFYGIYAATHEPVEPPVSQSTVHIT
jgi:hypothetical protein